MATRLTTASYIVLGLVGRNGTSSPYDLKLAAASLIGPFWSMPHAQMYAQCDRLVEAGLLSQERESAGRQRRLLSLTPQGRAALRQWLGESEPPAIEVRDLGPLRVALGAKPTTIAEDQLRWHKEQLAIFEETALDVRAAGHELPIPLQVGLGVERHYVEVWSSVLPEQQER